MRYVNYHEVGLWKDVVDCHEMVRILMTWCRLSWGGTYDDDMQWIKRRWCRLSGVGHGADYDNVLCNMMRWYGLSLGGEDYIWRSLVWIMVRSLGISVGFVDFDVPWIMMLWCFIVRWWGCWWCYVDDDDAYVVLIRTFWCRLWWGYMDYQEVVWVLLKW